MENGSFQRGVYFKNVANCVTLVLGSSWSALKKQSYVFVLLKTCVEGFLSCLEVWPLI